MNILTTELAEFTYAQILDGLPTQQAIFDSCQWIHDHPTCQLKHEKLCDGFLEKAREFRSHFDPSTLVFGKDVLAAFQKSQPGSKEFNLRLIELVVVACHQIGASLFKLDGGGHRHEVHNSWLAKARQEEETGTKRRLYHPPPAAFFHRFYERHEQYPMGVADVVGYWSEGRIFGGVVVFDRGESEQECKDMWIHGILAKGPRTLYPPTKEQFEALVAFLLADLSSGLHVDCPLPIHGTRLNRPRWDPWLSMRFHIFRDRYERVIPARPPPHRVTHTFTHWPELEDQWVITEMDMRRESGQPVDKEVLKRAYEGLTLLTPSSLLWRPRIPEYTHEGC
ncbi:hypothetical protein QBC33DRAFT_579124 [Phialemonium atrogriseum]|uniref:Uncharacterized protein n=1 Tax=Phialemonium atrogriseum TaxID=1093897 RepID=A0AAJ0FL50_9PEZI|nr:uncharacterized protein QBC33DRAFT_579124 [Phialemonium atrogriseum]KAK1766304.1 hypothetical protein QBC33DRAFT_579124 [Phialemonium atrogriseum]